MEKFKIALESDCYECRCLSCISHIHQHHHFQNTILFNSVLHNSYVGICVRTKLGTLNRHGENEMMIMIWWNTKTCVVALFWGFVKEITAQTTSIQTRFVLLSIYINGKEKSVHVKLNHIKCQSQTRFYTQLYIL